MRAKIFLAGLGFFGFVGVLGWFGFSRPSVQIGEGSGVGSGVQKMGGVIAVVGEYEVRFEREVKNGGALAANAYRVVHMPSRKEVKFSEIFGEEVLVSAVLGAIQDGVYSGDEATAKKFEELRASSSLEAVYRGLRLFGLVMVFEQGSGCSELLGLDSHTGNFAFLGYDATSGKASVHIGVPARSLFCNRIFPRLRLNVDAPEGLKPALEAAAREEKGYFPQLEQLKACEDCVPIDFTSFGLEGA